MNEFLQQFVIESRELVSQAVDGLLELEQSRNAVVLDAVFRAFHTLKGGAGIVDFAAMERAVHAAEEVLGEARSGQRSITSALVSGCLACLDTVSHWLESIASRGELPADDGQADDVVRGLAEVDVTAPLTPPTKAGNADWVAPLIARHRLRDLPLTAVHYTPSADCFLLGEDPAARIAGLPQLRVQEIVPATAWPSLSELDPYACNLVLTALSGASAEAVREHMRGSIGACEIADVSKLNVLAETSSAEPERVRELLQAQRALLAEEGTEHFPGRVAAAGRVAANVLLSIDRDEECRQVLEATEKSLATRSSLPLAGFLDHFLSMGSQGLDVISTAPAPRTVEMTLRVDMSRIDALVRLTGELTAAKNALAHTASNARENQALVAGEIKDRLKEFERLIDRLQHEVLALRVLPLRTVLQRFPRVLRELSSALGKPVNLQIQGDHTEADKVIVDMLFEPLLHALRNAIDHGIESPARRLELKKPLVATIQLRARRESDRVIVEVQDDGGGVDVARVREVALARQIVTAEALDSLGEPEIVDLIFAPGFSTASAVSELSGRGVGLDAVRTAIQRIGGQVTLTSRQGQGTTITFSLPFSVMVTQVLTVWAGGQTFGIPMDALLETVRVPQKMISGVGAARVMVHRDRTLPLIDLAGELGRALSDYSLDSSEVSVILVSVSDEIIALRVDRVGERIEVILKPLEGLLASLRGITGTTLLGNGEVLLVLDLWDLMA